ncbi:MAG: hypothetical protein KDB07_10605 [Planctomycetes bacterium]|nr:hypothetical protein [Planctomycetota bacterium]
MASHSRDPAITAEKQDWVKSQVKSNPSLSMYQIGEMVKDKFGSMIAFEKLREAFMNAGGKLGSRGRPKGSMNRPKTSTPAQAKKQDGRSNPAVTSAKEAYVAELVKANASESMYSIGEAVKKKFGTMLAFNKLREAFIAAGGQLGKRGRPKGSKNKPKAATKAKKESKPRASSNMRSAGRRKSDVAGYVARRALGRLSAHMVIVTSDDGTPVPYTFENKTEASAFVQKQLDAGIGFDRLGYYSKQEMGVRVTL